VRVAVLGCGPAGLLCALAVEQAGHTPVIYSRKHKSDIPGSQHLHGPVLNVTSPYAEGTIQFIRIGNARDYALKVYGDPERETGWDNYLQVYPSWNVQRAYDKLWDHFDRQIHHIDVDPDVVRFVVKDFGPGHVISTLPAQEICINQGHRFDGQRYYIKTLPTPEADREHEIVVYNGMLEDHWYRWSILGGKCTIESTQPFPGEEVVTGYKAVNNDCDCFQDYVHRCGRWAEWRHGVTMYNAYNKAGEIARNL